MLRVLDKDAQWVLCLCRYLNAVQTTAQHLLRYLAAAVVVNKRRRSLLKDMVKVRTNSCNVFVVFLKVTKSRAPLVLFWSCVNVTCQNTSRHAFLAALPSASLTLTALTYSFTRLMTCLSSVAWEQVLQQEEYEFSDPVTQFLTCLYVDFDFEGAQQKLAECETVLENDFFLTALKVGRCRQGVARACYPLAADGNALQRELHRLSVRPCCPHKAPQDPLDLVAMPGLLMALHSVFQDDFVDNARLLVFEAYCRIHQVHRPPHAGGEAQHGRERGGEVGRQPHPQRRPQRKDQLAGGGPTYSSPVPRRTVAAVLLCVALCSCMPVCTLMQV